MSKQPKHVKQKICDLCYSCVNDCVQVEPMQSCEHFKKGFTRHDYLRMAREENLNLKKLCTKNNISYNTMMLMLNGKEHLTYKYRTALNNRLFEKQEYLPYVDKFNNDDFDNSESSEERVACGQIE